MSKKIISYVLALAMIFGVFSNPALGYATTEAKDRASAVTHTTANKEVASDVKNTDLSKDNNDTEDGENNVTNDNEESDASQEETETVPEVGTVSGLKATAASHNKITLSWTAVEGATSYQVYRYNTSKKQYEYLKAVNTNSTYNYGLPSGTKYFYKVRACITEDGTTYNGDFSAETSCKTNPYLTTPANVKATAASCSENRISWSKVKGAQGYQVYRYSTPLKKYIYLFSTTKNSARHVKLSPYTLYRYKVIAYTKQDGKKYFSNFSYSVPCRTERTDRGKIVNLAYSKRNCSYKWGAKGPKRFDCSGFVYWIYKNADVTPDKKVPKTSAAGMYKALKKYKIGSSIKSLNKARPGDIIFFKRGGKISHVGIYYQDGKMIHAANPKKDICIEKVSNYNKWGYKVVGIVSLLD